MRKASAAEDGSSLQAKLAQAKNAAVGAAKNARNLVELSDDEDEEPKRGKSSFGALSKRAGVDKLMTEMGGKEGMQSMLKQVQYIFAADQVRRFRHDTSVFRWGLRVL